MRYGEVEQIGGRIRNMRGKGRRGCGEVGVWGERGEEREEVSLFALWRAVRIRRVHFLVGVEPGVPCNAAPCIVQVLVRVCACVRVRVILPSQQPLVSIRADHFVYKMS